MEPTIDGPSEAGTLEEIEVGSAEMMSLEVAARDYVWLYDYRHGLSPHAIARRDGVNHRCVREGIDRARALGQARTMNDPAETLRVGRREDLGFRLIPLFPLGAFTPQSSCPHQQAMKRGSHFCCMVCHASGMDDHPGLRRDPRTDPSPEPETKPEARAAEETALDIHETRKQRRRRQFQEAAVA